MLTTSGKYFKSVLLIILLTPLAIGIYAYEALGAETAETANPKVLLLNSYHKGFSWTDDQTAGVIDELQGSGRNVTIYVEYGDWKRFPYEWSKDQLHNRLSFKYVATEFDLVITTDDFALEFALENRAELFNDAPVIFSGVNPSGAAVLTAGYSQVTGVLEIIDPTETIRIARDINPGLSRIYLLFDQTESGISTAELVTASLAETDPDLAIIPMDHMSFQEVLKVAAGLNYEDDIILMTTYYRDGAGNIVEFETAAQQLSDASTVPVYHIYDFGLDHGAIGGNLICGRCQGVEAAKLALRVLDGEAASDIMHVTADSFRIIFDYNLLQRFAIRSSQLPPGSGMINQPFSFYRTYSTTVHSVLAAFIVLLAFIAILLFYIRQVRRMRLQLANSYEELEASEEELIEQYDKVLANQSILIQNEERYRLITESINDGIWELDCLTQERYISPRWCELLRIKREAVNEQVMAELVHPDDRLHHEQSVRDHIAGKTPFYECEYRLKLGTGEYRWFLGKGKALLDSNGRISRFVGSDTDIHSLKESQEKLHKLAFFDPLSGLPNRQSLTDELNQFFKNSSTDEVALYFLDIDNFKYINDTLGHTYGDKLLRKVGRRLMTLSDNDASFFRLGGDEFVILLKDAPSEELILDYANTLLSGLNEPFQIDNNTVQISASIGIARYPHDGANGEELLMNADVAMYKAKERGKGGFERYGLSLQHSFTERISIEKYLRNALANGELELYYQPLYHLQRDEVTGFEALLRWNSPELGQVPPLTFISIAESCQLILPIGEWVLNEACSFIKKIHHSGYPTHQVAVNISIVQLIREDFIDTVLNALSSCDLEPRFLEIEITESIFMESIEIIVGKLNKLREMGVQIALDDFGTGYSSLSYLKELPITTLKIDKTFIDDIPNDSGLISLASSILMIGRRMGLEVVAEGVETAEQLEYLRMRKCDEIQGYLISKPLPEKDVLRWLNENQEHRIPPVRSE